MESIFPFERDDDHQISIPREVLGGLQRGRRVRMASFLFMNMSGLLPETLNSSVSDGNRYSTNLLLIIV